MDPASIQNLVRDAQKGVPGAMEQLQEMGVPIPPPPPAAPPGPQSTQMMGPMGGGLVNPGQPQGYPAGDPSTIQEPGKMQMFIQALRGRLGGGQ